MENKIVDVEREIPVLLECDVVVVGGGPAGMSAAIGAADAGAKTVVVERYGCLGGNITICAVETPSWYRQESTTIAGGVQKEIENRMISLGAVSKTMFAPTTGYSYDTEIFKYMADQMIKEHGITPVYHCLGTVPYMMDDKACGIITESKSGRCAILAKRVVDCTGDGDMAARAGAPYVKGHGVNHEISAGTLKFFLSDVDIEKLEASMDNDPDGRNPQVTKFYHKIFDIAKEAGEPPIPDTKPKIGYTSIYPSDLNVNLVTRDYELDGTDVLSLTNSEIKQRLAIMRLIELFRKYGEGEGLGKAKLRNFAMAVGIRETRHISADYTLSDKDILGCSRFEDSIGVFPIYMDDENVRNIPFTNDYFQVPFRILVPQQVKNLLVAGRCASCSHSALPTIRQMDFCMVSGQAAGVASALSIKQCVETANVNIPALQKELERQGVRVF